MKRGRGQPTLLNADLQERMYNYIAAGNYPEIASQACGIHVATFYTWMRRGREGDGEKYIKFHDSMIRARAEAEARNVLLVERAAEKDWRAAAWYLERTAPERWALKRNIEVVDDRGSIPIHRMTEQQLLEIINDERQ